MMMLAKRLSPFFLALCASLTACSDGSDSSLTTTEPTIQGLRSAPVEYYQAAQGKAGEELRLALHNIIKGHKVHSYDQVWEILKDTDEDPNSPENLILFYTGISRPKGQGVATRDMNGEDSVMGDDDVMVMESAEGKWNREHVWAKSHGFPKAGMPPFTDVHHLRPADVKVNSIRSNLFFGEVNGGKPVKEAPGTFIDPSSELFEPADQFKGDVARIILYMDVRYEGDADREPNLVIADVLPTSPITESEEKGVARFGKLSDLLRWHKLDPVDDFERLRNDKIFKWQKNRNPFIDNPEYVDMIWGAKGSNP